VVILKTPKLNCIHFDDEIMLMESDGYYYGTYWGNTDKKYLVEHCDNPEEKIVYEIELGAYGCTDILFDYDTWTVDEETIINYVIYNLKHVPTCVKSNSDHTPDGDIFLINKGDDWYDVLVGILDEQ
jgi:hypothetical protein